MNKKLMKLLAGLFILVMVVAGCSAAEEETVQSDAETMDKTDPVMADEDMAKDDDVIGHSEDEDMKDDSMAEDGDMSEEDMDKDEAMEEVAMSNDGKMAPNFELMDINGELHSLADLKGEKVYLKYWASWCSICLAGLEEVDELFVEADGFTPYTIVTPDANGEQSKEDFINWFNGLGYENINVLFDMDGSIAKELGVRAFPTSVFIGSDGVLIQSAPGHKSNEDIVKVIDTFN